MKDYMVRYKGHYILRMRNERLDMVVYDTTLPNEAIPATVRVRGGFTTLASAKKYITRYGKPIKIRKVDVDE